ncbi:MULTISPECIES: ABC transporter permease [Glutamicibacter]|uniref:ABC transporter permease n=1 Tax=Glutamicibacter halophytocola TaxID=1933880 RepID=A0A5B8IN52_9MICC|nr:ABC transporter permease [Glutamicibacter halophytocola]MBF6673168.1 ABC transporter permease [Glutamicibacter sp. FBE19]ALG30601.1 peptide ABC transporter permease [Glutamicibacter halophytocola]NQD40167.1 ABC transporter permease [Glutamicibacter halophytocola]QDY66853.1 ABC transporter permease [Glutamicibacter halophytocola]UUX58994.1 ABC transporter permease [Glutamicibacter halophytocola]
MNYVIRKLGFYAIALWAALTLNFIIPRLLPGDPVDILLAKLQQRGGSVTEETRKAYSILLGGDDSQPLIVQYAGYLGNLFKGDLGVSVSYFPAPVTEVIGASMPWTVILVGVSTILAAGIGILLGTFAGWRPGTWLDSLVPATTLLAAVPYFWLALVLVYLLSRGLGLFPAQGGYDVVLDPGFNGPFLLSAIEHAVLPALTIVIAALGGWLLGMRNMMVSTLSEDYVLTARAKGLPERWILRNYAARNAVLPSVAGFAISLGFVVSGSVVTEQVFSYPGIGSRLLAAVTNNDYALMQGVFLYITVAVLAANLLVDLIYGLVDPRTRARG